MKNIIPVLTLATLAAAASAQSAAASSGLSYNYVSGTYARTSVTGDSGHTTDYSVSVLSTIGSSNFFVSATAIVGGTSGNTDENSVALGYLFKNVKGIADVAFVISSSETFGIIFRKDLGNNLEAAAKYARQNNDGIDTVALGVGYTFAKHYTLDLAWSHDSESSNNSYAASNTLSAGLRYNF